MRRSGLRALCRVNPDTRGLAGAICAIAIGAIGAGLPAHSDDSVASGAREAERIAKGRPTIGLVLAGGGARGAAHIGVLQVLEELRIPIDYVSGNSMGSIVGGYYAVGYSPDELAHEITSIDWVDIFTDLPARRDLSFRRKQDNRRFQVKWRLGFKDWRIRFPKGLVQGQKLDVKLETLALPVWDVHDFDNLHLPFRCAATDIETGEAVILRDGRLSQAIRASMSVPGVFAPVQIGDRLLVDGLLSNNIPIDAVKEFDPDIVIAVDIGTPPLAGDELDSAFAIAGQSMSLLMLEGTRKQLALLDEGDILLQPDLGKLTTADFPKVALAIERGRASAERDAHRLAHLSVSEAEWEQYLERQRMRDRPLPVIDQVRVSNNSGLDSRVLESRMQVHSGDRINPESLSSDMGNIYGLDIFESVDFQLLREGDRTVLDVRAKEKSWGSNNIRFGIQIQENFQDTHDYRFGAQINTIPVNRLGAEWRNEFTVGDELNLATEFYQPVSYSSQWFVALRAGYATPEFNVFDNQGNRVARYRRRQTRVQADVGRQLGHWGEVRAGFGYFDERASPIIGGPQFPITKLNGGSYFVRFLTDTNDRRNFPTHGAQSAIRFTGLPKSLGANENTEILEAGGSFTRTWRDNTINLVFAGGSNFSDDSPVQSLFNLGGFLKLSGLNAGEVSGQHFALGSIVGYRRIAAPAVLNVELPVYVGASLERGGAWKRSSEVSWSSMLWAGSVFFGADTPLGPFWIAGGASEGVTGGVEGSAYLFLGLPF